MHIQYALTVLTEFMSSRLIATIHIFSKKLYNIFMPFEICYILNITVRECTACLLIKFVYVYMIIEFTFCTGIFSRDLLCTVVFIALRKYTECMQVK